MQSAWKGPFFELHFLNPSFVSLLQVQRRCALNVPGLIAFV